MLSNKPGQEPQRLGILIVCRDVLRERQAYGSPVNGQEKPVRVRVGQEDDTVMFRRLVEPGRNCALLELVVLLAWFHSNVHSIRVSLREQRHASAEPLKFVNFDWRLERTAHCFGHRRSQITPWKVSFQPTNNFVQARFYARNIDACDTLKGLNK